MRVKEESGKASLKLNIKKKKKNLRSSHLVWWQLEGENVEAVTDFLFLDSTITADGDYSQENRRLLHVRKDLTNLDSVLKSKDITLLTKLHVVKAIIFPVVTYSCESWT